MINSVLARKRASWLFLAATLSCFLNLHAADSSARPWTLGHYQHTAWTDKEGAPSGVSCLAQTSDGYLWVGGNNGLYRFDGVRFVPFAPAPGEHLLSTQVQALRSDPSGGLWIGYEQDGISYLKDGHLTHYTANSGFPDGNLYSIVRDDQGDIWADATNGLMRFHGQTWTRLADESGLPKGRVRTLFIDKTGRLWLTAGRRVLSFDRQLQRFQDAGVALPEGSAFFLGQISDGTFVFTSSAKTLLRFKLLDHHLIQEGDPIPFDSAGITSDNRGGLWVATLGDGIYRFSDARLALGAERVEVDDAQRFRKIDGLSADYVWPVLTDREGTIWFGTEHGIDSFRPSSFSSVTLPDGIHDVAPARGPDGSLWVGSSNQPLLRVTDAGYVATSGPAYSIAIQQGATDDTVLTGTRGKIWQVDGNGSAKQMPPLPDSYKTHLTRSVLRDHNGNIWAAFWADHAGVVKLTGNEWTPAYTEAANSPPSREMASLFEDVDGTVWAAFAPNRLASFSQGGRKDFDASDVGTVRVFGRHQQRLWMGGERGIAYLENGRPIRVHLEGGFELRNVTGLLFSNDGAMWVHSVQGIVHVSPSELALTEAAPGHAMKYRLMDVDDGAPGTPSQEIPLPSAALGSDGRLWFASVSELSWLDPGDLVQPEPPPSVTIESLSVNGVRINGQGHFTLSPSAKSIDIAYSAPSFAAPRKVRFRYRLDGVDNDWSSNKSTRQVSYSNLPPGTYRFHVSASNSAGEWGQQDASVAFSIRPSFYQTWWFRLLCAVVCAAIIFLFIRWRITAASMRIRERLEVRDRERTRIAHHIHDTLLQTVQALLIQVQRAANAIPANEPAQAILSESACIAQQAVIEGRDRIVSLQSFSARSRDITAVLETIGKHLESIHGKSFEMSASGVNPMLSYAITDEIIDIAREAMLNAFTHSGGTKVSLGIAYGRHDIEISVSDDGIGIDPSVVATGGSPGHWGLVTIQERAGSIGGTVRWTDANPGTVFHCRVPYRFTLSMMLSNPIRALRRFGRRD